jgi:hypothetical protein
MDCIASQSRVEEDGYSVRPFIGLVFTATQLPQKARFELQKLIEANGGQYDKDLDTKRLTHLVAVRPEGDKFMRVRYSRDVRVVRQDWALACAQQNCTLSYLLQ